MTFYERLAAYYDSWGRVLRGEAAAASIFPNATDVGTTREEVYRRFLTMHAPSSCDIELGGFVFATDGSQSDQVDVLVTAKNVPRFRLGVGTKAFAWVHGLVGVVSVKSRLDRDTLNQALENIDSVPFAGSMSFPAGLNVDASVAAELPFRVVYASDGLSADTLGAHLQTWIVDASQRPGAKYNRLPHVIHVAGKCAFLRGEPGRSGRDVHTVNFRRIDGAHVDAIALAHVIAGLHSHATIAGVSLPNFGPVLDNLVAAIQAEPSSSHS